jgi:hypothetical protein
MKNNQDLNTIKIDETIKYLGGFPPIFYKTIEFQKAYEISKNKEFADLPASVNIKDLLKSRKNEKTLFDLE